MLKNRELQESFGTITYDAARDRFELVSQYPLEEILDAPLSAPLTLHWVLTLRCNARCSYCYLTHCLLSVNAQEKTLSVREAEELVEQFATGGGCRLYLTGGEPTLSPLLTPIVEKAYALGVKSVVNSNGIHISDKQLQLFQKCSTRLSFSLDSYEAERHNQARNQRSFNSIMAYLKIAKAMDIDVRIVTVWQGDVDLFRFADFLHNLGVSYWFIQLLQQPGKDNESLAKNLREFQEKMKNKIPEMNVKTVTAWYDGFFYVLPDGDVGTRVWETERKIVGNVREQELAILWRRNQSRSVRYFTDLLRYKRKKDKEGAAFH
jgi:molybdenum cofactor biosynthesis enzyme MoaA